MNLLLSSFVIAGLEPAIHPIETTHVIDGCAGQGPRMTSQIDIA
jgi:hypothetical protein